MNKSDRKGLVWERDFFGIDNKNSSKPPYLLYNHAMSFVMNNQSKMGWNPDKPRTVVGSEVFYCVQSYLPVELRNSLKLFCAIGTSVDFYYGIDGFFLLGDNYLTFDLTVRSNKRESEIKADMLLQRNKILHMKMWQTCQQIAERLQTP